MKIFYLIIYLFLTGCYIQTCDHKIVPTTKKIREKYQLYEGQTYVGFVISDDNTYLYLRKADFLKVHIGDQYTGEWQE